jgi:hypothetical protein
MMGGTDSLTLWAGSRKRGLARKLLTIHLHEREVDDQGSVRFQLPHGGTHVDLQSGCGSQLGWGASLSQLSVKVTFRRSILSSMVETWIRHRVIISPEEGPLSACEKLGKGTAEYSISSWDPFWRTSLLA